MINDQATTLRQLASTETLDPAQFPDSADNSPHEPDLAIIKKMRSIAVTGGKGGVGKTNFSVNVALELGALGNSVTLLDADFGLANADLLCGVTPKYHLGHVITGSKELKEIAIEIGENVLLLPGGSGIEELANVSFAKNVELVRKLQKFEETADFLVIDTAAGIGESVSSVLLAATEIVVVTTPEPTAVVDAYATIKIIFKQSPDKKISLVVNNVSGIGEAEQVFKQLNTAAHRFLAHKIEFLGSIPRDTLVSEAVCDQIPVVKHSPETPASRAIRLIARQLQKQSQNDLTNQIKAQSFWHLLSEN